ncbi:unnamed protein product [Kluyveromyces dobzhanskii CBS 2104]|uniref:WGS project CCBQ000000000 data, contig 00105 n=1 Tax=Kluyveromyces dobzhanskii CBS 2104 TaxID=1427455 RepID=A0A0A8KZ81_9SACH|nr:unnamed protein product [Kluyveromyces dobzhanskii CBS 2104]
MPVIEHNDQRFELSHAEEQKLNEFQMITSFAADELSNVIKLLRNHSWQLEHALGRYFDGNWKENLDYSAPHSPTAEQVAAGDHQQAQTGSHFTDNQEADLPISSRIPNFLENPLGVVPKLPVVHRLPYNYKEKLKILTSRQNQVTDLYSKNSLLLTVLFLPNLLIKIGAHLFSWLDILISYAFKVNLNKPRTQYNWMIPNRPQEERQPKDTFTDITEVCGDNAKDLLSLCSTESYNQIFDECESKYKFMLLILLGPIAGDEKNVCHSSKTFLTHFLCHPSTIELFKQHGDNLKIYIRTVNDPECWALSKQLKLKYSLECLLVANVHNRVNSNSGSQIMSLLAALKTKSLPRFQDSWKAAVRRYSPELVVSQTELNELEMARKIKELQDEAYQMSLNKDLEKQLEREKQEKELKEMILSKSQKEESLKIKKLCYELTLLLHSLTAENEDENVTKEKKSDILFRTSDGKRVVRKYKGTDTLRDIYIDIAAHLYLTASESSTQPKTLDRIYEKLRNIYENPENSCIAEESDIKGKSLKFFTITQLEAKLRKDLSRVSSKIQLKDVSFDFELISPFPRCSIPNDPSVFLQTRSELWPNGSLLVESLYDDGSSEEEYEGNDQEDQDDNINE